MTLQENLQPLHMKHSPYPLTLQTYVTQKTGHESHRSLENWHVGGCFSFCFILMNKLDKAQFLFL